MDNLKDTIFKKLMDITVINEHGCEEIADTILALPSGLEDLTIQGVLDWAKAHYGDSK